MKKQFLTVLLFGVSTITLAGCGQTSTSTTSTKPSTTSTISVKPSTTVVTPVETTIKDMIGRDVTITPGSYKKVVCIGAGALRMYSYIGDVNLLSGVEDIDNYTLTARPKMFDTVARPYFIANKEVFKTLPSCGVGGPQAQTAEAEKILSCNPDIVISEYEDVDKENALQSQLGVPVITLKSGADGVFDTNFSSSMTLLGKVFNEDAKAKKLNDFVIEQTNAIQTKIGTSTSTKKAYICGLGNWGTTNHLMTAQNYKPFTIAKVSNVVTDLAKNGIQAITEEKFEALKSDIDVMFIDSAAVKNIKPLVANDPTIFDGLKAKTTKEVYLQMAYNAYYTNYEMALANTWYNAKIIYPEAFSDVDMVAKTNEITKAFLGKEIANEIFNDYANSFGGYQKIDLDTFFK